MRLIDLLSARFVRTEPTPELTPIQRQVEDNRATIPSGFIRRVLDMRDATPELMRVGRPGLVHLSELPNLCARQHCLMLSRGIAKEQPVTGAHRVLWKIGRAVESHVRNQLVEGMPSAVFGRWVCACGESERFGHRPADHRCSLCNKRIDQYAEMTLVDQQHGVCGNPDIVVRVDNRVYAPVEIKSRERDAWMATNRPDANHILQAAGYRRLLQASGFPVHPDVIIVYVSKDFAWGSPYKEFHVKITSQIERQLDEMFAEARLVRDYVATGILPERTACSHIGGRRAKGCVVKLPCFEE